MDHLRYSGLPFEAQREAFLDIVSADPLVRDALVRARALALPDWLVVSGALYNSVWNHLTGKPSGYGIRDVDLFYFDDSVSTDRIIQAATHGGRVDGQDVYIDSEFLKAIGKPSQLTSPSAQPPAPSASPSPGGD